MGTKGQKPRPGRIGVGGPQEVVENRTGSRIPK